MTSKNLIPAINSRMCFLTLDEWQELWFHFILYLGHNCGGFVCNWFVGRYRGFSMMPGCAAFSLLLILFNDGRELIDMLMHVKYWLLSHLIDMVLYRLFVIILADLSRNLQVLMGIRFLIQLFWRPCIFYRLMYQLLSTVASVMIINFLFKAACW